VAEGVSEGTNARPREIDRESCASRRTIFETPRERRESRSCTVLLWDDSTKEAKKRCEMRFKEHTPHRKRSPPLERGFKIKSRRDGSSLTLRLRGIS